MRRDTGFTAADAQEDFQRARRRQLMSQLARRVSRDPGDVDVVLPFDEVVAALGRVEERYVGLQAIELDTVLGTVGRERGGFDRQFRPTTARVRARWERIANAARRGEPLPPIPVARARPPSRPRPRAHPARRPVGLRPAGGGRRGLAFRAMQDRAEFVDRRTAARLWFEDEYVPVVEMLRDAGMIGGGTETEAYLRIVAHRYVMMRTHEWHEEIPARLRDSDR